MIRILLTVCLWLVTASALQSGVVSAQDSVLPHSSYSAEDSLQSPSDPDSGALQCLQGLCWPAESFSVQCVPATRRGVDALVQFPSARPVGVPQNDQVTVEWYAVRNDAGRAVPAPAMVVVHESGRGMTVGRMVARGLRDRGIHGFMVELPFYGQRRPPHISATDRDFGEVMRQGIADVRRTRDAVAALPVVSPSRISLQGTSLGGFLSATAAGLDGTFQNVFILLAGGDLPRLIETGERETAQVKRLLASRGFTGTKLRQLLSRFEPNRLAHRIDEEHLWLYTASFDTTVPPTHADSFAAAAGLADSHHIRMPATHYSGVIFLPMVLDQIAVRSGGRAISSDSRLKTDPPTP